MQTIKVNLKQRSYDIVIGQGITAKIGEYIAKLGLGADAYIITNQGIKKACAEALTRPLKKSGFSVQFKLVADTEKSKSMETASVVLEDLARYDKKREIFIIAFGGGVIGDLSGFIAAIYKRGIPYIQVPTTLLAQVDSSIGGKTGIDLRQGKNLAGAFYQPQLVFSDTRFLTGLDKFQVSAGLAEVIKYSLIKDKKLFYYLKDNLGDIFKFSHRVLEYIIGICSRIKAGIVEKDELDNKTIRAVLNFGHTIGHAIEASGGYRLYNHGQAIALGMLAAASISVDLKLAPESITEEIKGLFNSSCLPTKLRGLSVNSILSAHYRDKKFIGRENKFVLLRGIGKAEIVTNVPLEIIKRAVTRLK